MNPYETPREEIPATAAPDTPSAAPALPLPVLLREYFSLSGSFSRLELLIATIGLGGIMMGLGSLAESHPATFPPLVVTVLTYALYLVWGLALGKRSRDLGTTFTYGMVVGLIFPVLGLIFLFQAGAKSRRPRS